jgi:mycothiol synthase
MSRPTSLPVAAAVTPPGVRVRTFLPSDEEALLEVNAAAFAHHPEQGHMTSEDFRERTAEAWFDPQGLFLAVPDEDDPDLPLLGFHWTKVHRDEDPPYGEVYVVATNPRAAGRGLGTLLTKVGLAHLATQGVDEVILYVDGDNDPAIAVYEGQGFRSVRTEVQYRGATGHPRS